MLTYASIPLSIPTAAVALAIEQRLSLSDIYDFDRSDDWPGSSLNWTFPNGVKHRPVRAGVLTWPCGASRFAIGYFCATSNQLNAIRQVLATQSYSAQPLVISQEDQDGNTVSSITASLWMLPPRQLLGIPDANGLHLLTFVDARYFWWFRDTGDLPVVAGTTTWQDLYDSLGTALGVTIGNDAIEAAYLKPASVLTARYEQSPLMLDAVAYNVGQRIVVDLDGTVHAYGVETSAGIVDSNLADDNSVMGGGVFSFVPGQPNDLPAVLPGSVRVTFPKSSAGVATGDVYAVTVTLATLNLADLGTTGNSSIKTFHDTREAIYTASAQPSNATELTALAKQISTDFYRYQLASLDLKLVGIVDWQIEGLSDAVEWVYTKSEVSTRILRPGWNDLIVDLLHGAAPLPAPAWVKVTSATPSSITLSGGSISGYPAVLSTPNAATGAWTDGTDPVWFFGPNADVPTSGNRYQGRLLYTDTKGVGVWASVIDSGGGSSGIALLSKTGSSIDAACTSLKADADGVLTFTNLATNDDQITITNAGTTQRGVVSTGTQSFAGNKTFASNVNVEGATTVADILWVNTGSGSNGFGGASSFVFPAIELLPNGIQWWNSTGTSALGSILAVSGTDGNMWLAGTGSISWFVGGSVLATNATSGFFGIPIMNGTPTGTPADASIFSATAPMVFDYSTNKLWIRNVNTGAWKSVTLT